LTGDEEVKNLINAITDQSSCHFWFWWPKNQ